MPSKATPLPGPHRGEVVQCSTTCSVTFLSLIVGLPFLLLLLLPPSSSFRSCRKRVRTSKPNPIWKHSLGRRGEDTKHETGKKRATNKHEEAPHRGEGQGQRLTNTAKQISIIRYRSEGERERKRELFIHSFSRLWKLYIHS